MTIDWQGFLVVMLSAAVLQNAVFTRGLGLSKRTASFSSIRKVLFFGFSMTLISFLSVLLMWPMHFLIRENNLYTRLGLRYPSSVMALLCNCLVLVVLYFFSKAYLPRYHYHYRDLLPQVALNCAVLGPILIALTSNYSFLDTIAFSLGTGLGYTAALLLLFEGRRKILLCDVPRSFRGLPINLLYIGIFSLAIYGLIGHQIPT